MKKGADALAMEQCPHASDYHQRGWKSVAENRNPERDWILLPLNNPRPAGGSHDSRRNTINRSAEENRSKDK
jgi:hypothetical protein